MTNEQAIKLLHPDTTREALAEVEYYGGFNGKEAQIKAIEEACVMACEALKKQIPKKVEWIMDPIWGKSNRQPVCPVCDYHLTRVLFIGDGGKRVTYCEHCGQAIDWRGDQE